MNLRLLCAWTFCCVIAGCAGGPARMVSTAPPATQSATGRPAEVSRAPAARAAQSPAVPAGEKERRETTTPPPYRPDPDDAALRKPGAEIIASADAVQESATSSEETPAARGDTGTAPVQTIARSTSVPETERAAGHTLNRDWQTIGTSSGGRAIEARRIGTGPQVALILASLHGNESASVAFVERMSERLLTRAGELPRWSLVFVRSPNPDGLAESTLTNHRGVALNKNFPSDNAPVHRTPEMGESPLSEPETQLLVRLLDELAPERVIHIRSGTSERALLLVNEPAVEGIKERINRDLMDGGVYEAYKRGSLEEYTATRLKQELIVLWLPMKAEDWLTQLPSLTTALIDRPVAADSEEPAATSVVNSQTSPTQESGTGRREEAAPKEEVERGRTASPPEQISRAEPARPDDLFAPYTPPGRNAPSGSSVAGPGAKGYVQILPPPPDLATMEDPDPRYFELVPPP